MWLLQMCSSGGHEMGAMTGVTFNKKMNKWTARAKNIHIDTFDTEEEAMIAREHFLQDHERAIKRGKPQPYFSLTASPCIFTMANYPTSRRMRESRR